MTHFSVPFSLVNPHEGKRQDASHPEGWHSPVACPSPVLSYQGSGRGTSCFISLWWLQPPMPTRGMWSHKQTMSWYALPLALFPLVAPLSAPPGEPPWKPPSTLRFHLTSSTSTPPSFHFNSNVYVRNLQDHVAQALGITADQCQTHPDLVPTPRAAVCIPLLHLSYLSDPFSLPITGNCFLL